MDRYGGSGNRGTPSSHPFADGLSITNQPAIGDTPFISHHFPMKLHILMMIKPPCSMGFSTINHHKYHAVWVKLFLKKKHHFWGPFIYITSFPSLGSPPFSLSGLQEQRSNASLELQRKQQLELIHSQALSLRYRYGAFPKMGGPQKRCLVMVNAD